MIPEPFSITLSVFATIGFANLVRQGAQALSNDVEAIRTAPADILRILKDTALVQYRIDLWKRIWLFQPDTHADYPLFLWGDGWEHIQHQIETIEEVSSDINKILAPFAGQYESQKPVSLNNHNRPLGAVAEQRVLLRAADQKYISSQLWWGRKIDYVLSKSKELKELLDLLPNRFDTLNRICEETYFEKHKVNKSMPYDERRDIATSEMLVTQAWKSRQVSRALYEKCRSAGEGDIELELSLMKWKVGDNAPRPFNAGIPEHLCYYLTIPSSTLSSIISNGIKGQKKPAAPQPPPAPAQLEVLIEEIVELPANHHDTLKDACLELRQKDTCYIRNSASETDTIPKPIAFKVWRSSDMVGDSGRAESKLQELLTDAAFAIKASANDLSFRERIEVAYRVAECTLLLLETSWLSCLASSSITRAHELGNQTRYRLLVDSGGADGDEPHEAQTLRVGQILRELALGSNIGPFDRDIDLALVSRELGRQYQRALDFCYRANPSTRGQNDISHNRDTFSRAALVEFFNEVFLPLAELHQANIPMTDQDDSPEHDLRKSALSFLPNTYTDKPTLTFSGLIPTLSTSRERPATLLSTVRASMKALSIRSTSTLGQFRRTDAIVYYLATQKFAKVPREDVPEDAHRLEIPSRGMTYDIYLPSDDSSQKKLIATLQFEELGPRVAIRRLLGKINELYVVDHLSGVL